MYVGINKNKVSLNTFTPKHIKLAFIMKTFFAGALLASVSVAFTSTDFKFVQYLAEHNKNYPTLNEYNQRLAHFAAIDELIEEHNSSNASFKLGHNIFSDMTAVEKQQRLGFKAGAEDHPREFTHHETENLPTSVDWRTAGAVNAIKDQGQCGSCWAFSAVGTFEGAHFLATGNLLSFAEQQLVDCNRSWTGNHGCNGGWYYTAWSYFQSSFAILESDYKYTARDGTCEYTQLDKTNVETLKTTFPAKNSSDQIKAALAGRPISVAIEADKAVFQQYSSGIFDSP